MFILYLTISPKTPGDLKLQVVFIIGVFDLKKHLEWRAEVLGVLIIVLGVYKKNFWSFRSVWMFFSKLEDKMSSIYPIVVRVYFDLD